MNRRRQRRAALGALLGLGVLSLAALALGRNTPAHAQGPSQVAVVVQFADGSVSTHCVTLDREQATGLEVLSGTGLPVVYEGSGGLGARVCKIGPDGCDDPGQCFCQCKGTTCLYWSYWHLVDGAWQYSIAGASLYKVTHGAVEGWAWGIGSPQDAPKPPLISFEQVCGAEESTPTPTPGSVQAPMPTAVSAATVTPAQTCPVGLNVSVVTPTAAATEMPTLAAPAPTATPASATALPAVGGSTSGTEQPPQGRNYLVFGIIVVVLAIGAGFVLRGRRRA